MKVLEIIFEEDWLCWSQNNGCVFNSLRQNGEKEIRRDWATVYGKTGEKTSKPGEWNKEKNETDSAELQTEDAAQTKRPGGLSTGFYPLDSIKTFLNVTQLVNIIEKVRLISWFVWLLHIKTAYMIATLNRGRQCHGL